MKVEHHGLEVDLAVVNAITLERDVLRDELEEARHLISFLHGCLTDPVFSYAYPGMTVNRLEAWDVQWPLAPMCVHSFQSPGCESCAARVARGKRRERWEQINTLDKED